MAKKYLWLAIFTGIFALSIDFWAWQKTISLSFFSLPSFVWYFAFLQLLLSFAIWVFISHYWRSLDKGEENDI